MEKGRYLFTSLDKVWLLLGYFHENHAFPNTFFNEILYRIIGVARFLDGRGEH